MMVSERVRTRFNQQGNAGERIANNMVVANITTKGFCLESKL